MGNGMNKLQDLGGENQASVDMDCRGRLVRWRPRIEACLLLLAGCVMFYTAVFNGLTYDETAHINTGLAFWAEGKPNLDPLHPPFRAIFGLPAYWLLSPPPQHITTPFPAAHASGILIAGRLIMVAIFLAWSWLFGRLVARWLGSQVGLAAMALILFEPTMVAHACLATTDIPFMITTFLSAAAAFEWVRRPGWLWAFLLGVAMGLTMLAKFNAALWFFGLVLGAGVYWIIKRRPRFKGKRAEGCQLALALVIAWIIFCTSYRFEGVGTPLGQMNLGRSEFGLTMTLLGAIPCPIPVPVMEGLDELLALQDWRVSYFHGDMRPGGAFFWYFPALLALKLPLAFLGLLSMAMVAWVRGKGWGRPESWFFIIPLVFFFVMIAFVFDLQIGVRHIAPVFPFLAIAAAWATVASSGWPWRVAAWGLVAATIFAGVDIAPNQLGYFNQLAGGPAGGWHWFNDSNQDWGQGGPAINRYITRKGRYYEFDPIDGKTTGGVCVTTNGLVGINTRQHEKMRWLRDGFEVKKFVEPCWVIFEIDKDHWEKHPVQAGEPMS